MEELDKIFNKIFSYYNIDAITFTINKMNEKVVDFELYVNKSVLEGTRFIMEDLGNKIEEVVNKYYEDIFDKFDIKNSAIIYIDFSGTYVHLNEEMIALTNGRWGIKSTWI